jgi:hypothetical protein
MLRFFTILRLALNSNLIFEIGSSEIAKKDIAEIESMLKALIQSLKTDT